MTLDSGNKVYADIRGSSLEREGRRAHNRKRLIFRVFERYVLGT